MVSCFSAAFKQNILNSKRQHPVGPGRIKKKRRSHLLFGLSVGKCQRHQTDKVASCQSVLENVTVHIRRIKMCVAQGGKQHKSQHEIWPISTSNTSREMAEEEAEEAGAGPANGKVIGQGNRSMTFV